MRKLIAVLIGAIGFCAACAANAAERAIAVGDTVEISVVGMPELQKRALVNEDGDISYPLLGAVKAAGLSTNELRSKLIDQLARSGALSDPKIGVEIAARQPFYVTGDVMKPGAQPYVLNVTVRAAVALAGGLDPVGARGARVVNPAEIKGQYETLAIQFVKLQHRLRRLEAELAKETSIKFDRFPDLPVSDEIVAKLGALETKELEMRLNDTEDERNYLKTVSAQIQREIDSLAQRRQTEEESVRQQEDETAKIKGLADRGIIVQGRLLEMQRAMLLLKSQLFDSIAKAAQAQRLLSDYNRRLQSLDETRRLTVLKEMQDAYADAAATTARLTTARQQLTIKRTSEPPAFTIYRQKDGSRLRVEADENTNVSPGDILEVDFGVRTAVAGQ
jgi:polysaccharide export outer membrane protein